MSPLPTRVTTANMVTSLAATVAAALTVSRRHYYVPHHHYHITITTYHHYHVTITTYHYYHVITDSCFRLPLNLKLLNGPQKPPPCRRAGQRTVNVQGAVAHPLAPRLLRQRVPASSKVDLHERDAAPCRPLCVAVLL